MKNLKLTLLLFAAAMMVIPFLVQGAQVHAQADVFNLLPALRSLPQVTTSWNTIGSPSPQANVQRISTVTIQPFFPFQTSVTHIKEEYSGSMGTLFTYDVGSFGIEHISNLTYTANSGVTCSHNANLLITCTGSSISQVTINFDWTGIASDYVGNTTWWGYQGYSNYPLDYTFYINFPDSLVYIKPYSLAPVSVTVNQITWYQANTTSLPGIALFSDSRVQVLYLPLMSK